MTRIRSHGNQVIAIDGPSGTGKSTLARSLATRLGAGYLDTGALYRLVTVHVLAAGTDPDDDAAVAESLAALRIDAPTDPAQQRHFLDGVDVTERIRDAEVTGAVSAVSANPAVREFLLGLQRDRAYSQRMVVEGRDIGTVVTPDAAVKIYLTADAGVRADRRFRQLTGTAPATMDEVAESISRRDRLDSSREHAPLDAASDAEVIDSTQLSADETLAAALAVVRAHGITEPTEPPEPVSRPVRWFRLGGKTDPVPERRWPVAVDRGRRIGIALSHLMYRMTVRGEHHVPPTGPVLVVANHTTFADGPMLFGKLPRRVSFLIRTEIFWQPLGWLLRAVGQYEIDPAAPQRGVLLAAMKQLRDGGAIGIFPEGHRTDGSVSEVFNGAGWLAVRSGATVVPVALRGTARPDGRRVRRFRPRVHALVGAPVRISKGAGRHAVDDATATIQQRLVDVVADLDRGIVAADRVRARSGWLWKRS